MISIINGYVCTTSCEAAAAKQGKDPHAPPGQLAGADDKKKTAFADPATILDGALKDFVNAVGSSGDASAANAPRQPQVNILA